MTTPTTAPVPSTAAADLLFNAEKLDEAVNGADLTYLDRLGVARLTLAGAVARISAVNTRGAWASSTAYAARDVVSNSGTWYIALTAHTSGATFAGDLSSRWRVYQGVLSSDLTSTSDQTKAAGLIAYNFDLAYPPGSVGRQMREVYTPNIKGCVGDGSADDGVAFAAALAEAVTLGRALVLRSGATYQLTTFTGFSNSAPLRIIGNGATIRGPGGSVDFLSPAANFDIRDVRFANWRGIVSRLAAQSGSITDARFEDNTVTGCTGICINIERPIESYWIDNNKFLSCTGGYAVRIGENTFASQDTWKEGWIRGNRVNSLSGSGTTSAVAFLVYGREVTISDNKINGVTQGGTGEAWGIYTKMRYGQVTDNTVQNVTTASNTDLVGINIKGATRGVTSSPQGFAVTVQDNHVRNIGVVGTRGVGIRGQTDDVLIVLNQCEDCGGVGIVADETAVHRNVAISDNIVSYTSVVAGTVGIRIEGQGTGDTVDKNKIYNAQTGIVARTGPSGTMADARVAHNQMFGCTFNIVFDSFAGCTLNRLVIDDNVVNGGTFGLLFNGSAGTITGLRVRNNDFARAATPVSGIPGTSPIVFGNSGYLSATATWNPPSIANGASAATTISVPGAAVGDMVMASFSVPLGGLLMGAQISAANTAEVRLVNASGGAVDLASGTVSLTVSKGLA